MAKSTRAIFAEVLAKELIGPPRRLRWLRTLLPLAALAAVALAFPRIDTWPQAHLWPLYLVSALVVPGLWPVHRERILGRPTSWQVGVYLASVVQSAIGIAIVVPLSLAFGAKWGQSPIDRLVAQLPDISSSPWILAGLLLVFALLRYRADKREEAKLRAQAAAERPT
jgi:hypothetical protein